MRAHISSPGSAPEHHRPTGTQQRGKRKVEIKIITIFTSLFCPIARCLSCAHNVVHVAEVARALCFDDAILFAPQSIVLSRASERGAAKSASSALALTIFSYSARTHTHAFSSVGKTPHIPLNDYTNHRFGMIENE